MKKLICAVTVLAVSTVRADTILVDDDAHLSGNADIAGVKKKLVAGR